MQKPKILIAGIRKSLNGDKANHVRIYDAYKRLGYDVDFYAAYPFGYLSTEMDTTQPDMSKYDLIQGNQQMMRPEQQHVVDLINRERRKDSKFICWNVDLCGPQDHTSNRKYDQVKKYAHKFDHFITTDGSYDWAKEGIDYIHIFQGVEEIGEFDLYDIRPEYDVVFTGICGEKYSFRLPLVDAIGKQFNMISNKFFYGPKRQLELNNYPYITFVRNAYGQAFCNLYRTAKAALVPWGYPGVENYWSNRLYLATATGTPCVVGYVKGIENEFIIGKEILVYNTIGEAKKQIQSLLDNEQEAVNMGMAARKRTLENYKYSDRVETILDKIYDRR